MKMKNSIFKCGSILLMAIIFSTLIPINTFSKSHKDNLVVNTLTLNENNNKILFDLKYPEVKLENEHVQNKINILIKQHVYEFKKYLEEIYKESNSIDKDGNDTSPLFASKFVGLSDFKYEVVSNILSLTIKFSQFTGGAHPMTYVRNYNFDLNTGDIIKLNGLFNKEGKETHKSIIDKFIINQMNKSPEMYFKDEFKGVGENTQYYLTNDSLVVFFQLYEIAPYSSGIVEFKIPFSQFGNSINIG